MLSAHVFCASGMHQLTAYPTHWGVEEKQLFSHFSDKKDRVHTLKWPHFFFGIFPAEQTLQLLCLRVNVYRKNTDKKYNRRCLLNFWDFGSQTNYRAANIRAMLHCCCTNDQPPPWLQIEEASCISSSLMSLLCSPTTISQSVHSDSIVVKNCLKIWTQFKQHFTLQSIPGLAPFYSNPLFTLFYPLTIFTLMVNLLLLVS